MLTMVDMMLAIIWTSFRTRALRFSLFLMDVSFPSTSSTHRRGTEALGQGNRGLLKSCNLRSKIFLLFRIFVSNLYHDIEKALFLGLFYTLAGEERIELSITVLETAVMPLNYSPVKSSME